MSEAATDAEASVAADEASGSSSNASTITTLESLQKQSSHTRRMRPPDVHDTAGADGPRVPLRSGPRQVEGGGLRAPDPGKLAHRESRLGLRGFFSRNKSGGGQDVRASIVDFSGWPYFHSGPRSDSALSKNSSNNRPTTASSTLLQTVPQETVETRTELPVAPTSSDHSGPSSTFAPTSTPYVSVPQPAEPAIPLIGTPSTTKATKKPTVPTRSRPPAQSSRAVRGSLATWDPPPLFQAYPQAIKHAQLPICTTSIEVLMRLQGSVGGADAAAREGDSLEGVAAADKTADKAKRRHRRNTSGSSMKLDWVSKIYVLVTSGYLLQYSAEGSFDRLPEKILPISRDSAAFASDLIPGRHWVLRVSSSMDADGSQTNDSRSLFSRLPFRGSERRHASTFLMVFEGAEEMESWITILRREIEQLGGKKHLSETGKPKVENGGVDPRFQVNHRTLVVRDPERFSRILSPSDVAHIPRRSPRDSVHLDAPSPAATMSIHDRDPLSDDMSTTNSIYSQDGRQLENLRDSAGNRFSYISSGQRTIVTSDSSSPPCSPVRDSFTSNHNNNSYVQIDEQQSAAEATFSTPSPPLPMPPQQLTVESTEARLRPNAAAILERRQSMQILIPTQRVADMHMLPTQLPPQQPPPTDALPRLPTSSFSATSSLSKPLPPPVPLRRETNYSLFDTAPSIPNFSVPHSASKRYSAVMTTPTAPLNMPPTQDLPPPPAPGPALAATYSAFPQPPPRDATRPQPSAFGPPSTRNSRRRLPPPSLAFSRPLSIVADHASPSATSPPLKNEVVISNRSLDDSNLSSPGYGPGIPDTPALFNAWRGPPEPPVDGADAKPTLSRSGSYSSLTRPIKPGSSGSDKSFSTAPIEAPVRNSPRRHSSLLALRSVSDTASERIETRTVVVPQRASMILPMSKYNALSPKLPDEDDPRDNWKMPPPVHAPLAPMAPMAAPLAPIPPPLAPPPSQPLPQPPSRPVSRGQSLSRPTSRGQLQAHSRPPSRPASRSQSQSRTNSLTRLRSRSPTPPTSSHSMNNSISNGQAHPGFASFATRRPAEYKRASMFVQPSASVGINGVSARGVDITSSRPLSLYHATAMSRAGGSVDTGRGRTSIKPEPLATLTASHANITSAPNVSNPNGPPLVHARARSTSSKAVLYRRSLPQLANGPPPAPPPTCALPPLPVKANMI